MRGKWWQEIKVRKGVKAEDEDMGQIISCVFYTSYKILYSEVATG